MNEMNALTLRDLQKAMIQRTEESFHPVDDWSAADYMNAITGELGEAANFIKKIRRLDDGEEKAYNQGVTEAELKIKVGKELADILAYVFILAERLELDMQSFFIEKFNEVSDRVGSQRKLVDYAFGLTSTVTSGHLTSGYFITNAEFKGTQPTITSTSEDKATDK